MLAAINNQDDYQKTRNYWKYLKAKLKKESPEVVSVTTQLKLMAADGKRYNTDMLDANGVILLAKSVPNHRATAFLDWLTYSDNTIDGQSRKKAYMLFESKLLDGIPVGTVQGLQQIHSLLLVGIWCQRDPYHPPGHGPLRKPPSATAGRRAECHRHLQVLDLGDAVEGVHILLTLAFELERVGEVLPSASSADAAMLTARRDANR